MICMFKAIQYCYLMYLRTFMLCLKINELVPAKFISAPGLAWQAASKKTKLKLDILTDVNVINGGNKKN